MPFPQEELKSLGEVASDSVCSPLLRIPFNISSVSLSELGAELSSVAEPFGIRGGEFSLRALHRATISLFKVGARALSPLRTTL